MFVLGDFVFAKVHGYRPWPARVLGRYGTVSKIKYSVFFYGTCNTAKVSSSHIFDFNKNKRRLGSVQTEQKNTDFRRAMAHMWKAYTKPETDSKYYQVLAGMKDERETCLAYEMLTPTTESDSEDSQTSTETPKQRKSKDLKQYSHESSSDSEDSSSDSEDSSSDSADSSSESTTETDRSLEENTSETESSSEEETTETESSSKEEQAPTALKKPKTSMSLQYNHNDAPYKAHVPNVLENHKGSPLVDNAHLQDLEDKDNADPVPHTLKKHLKNLEDDKDSKTERIEDRGDGPKNDQPIDLCCRYIPGGEQQEKGVSTMGNAHLQDLKEQDYADPVSGTLKEKLKNLEDDRDSKLEGNKDDVASETDQPINLCCRHITGDEQRAKLA